MLMPSPLFSATGHARAVPTCLVVIVAAVLASVRTPGGMLAYKSSEVLAIVLPVAGTIVALALPAAQLAQSVMESFLSNAQELVKGNRPISGIVTFLSEVAAERRRDLEAMKWVVYFGLISFLAGLCGLLGAFSQAQIGENLAVRDLIACLATGFLVASVLWFLPVVRSSFNFAKADNLIELLRRAQAAAEPERAPKPARTPVVNASPRTAA
jgi:hypothetical protein